MSYQPKTWENKPSTASPINATNLNHMEGGIKTNDDNIIGAQNAILTLQGEMLQAQGDISALETLVDSIFPIDTASGNPAVITDAFGGACKSLELTLEPIQSGSGTPSPQNVRPISGRTQSVVTRTGKNLVNPSTGSFTSVASWVSLENVNANTVTNGTPIYLPEGTYTLSYAERTTAWTTQIFGADGSTILNSSQNSVTFTVSADTLGYIRINVGYQQAVSFKIQIEVGSTATPYEPYNAQTITRTYGTTIYGGSDDVTGEGATSEWTLITPTVTSVAYSASAQSNYALCNVSGLQLDADAISNMYAYTKTSVTASEGTFRAFAGTFAIYDNDFTTKEIAQAKLNDCRICYKVATPTSIPLTAQNVTLLHGDNVLTTDADNIECEYSADIALYIDKKIAEGISQGNRSLSKGGVSEEEPKEEVKEEVKEEDIKIKEAEPLTKEVR